MKRLILHSERLQQGCVRIESIAENESCGTGFLISGNKILTARHVVILNTDELTDYSQQIIVNITFPNINNKEWVTKAILISDDFENDIALLELIDSPNQDIRSLPLTTDTPQYNGQFSTCGYPFEKNEGGHFRGEIIQTDRLDRHDIELKCDALKKLFGAFWQPFGGRKTGLWHHSSSKGIIYLRCFFC